MIKQLSLVLILSIFSVIAEDAKIGQFPYHVSIQGTTDDHTYQHVCSGAIITADVVVTTASCYHAHYTSYRVISGIIHLNETNDVEQERNVKEFHVHPDFDGVLTHYLNDIAVIKLEAPFELGEYIDAVPLPPSESVPKDGVTLTGWNLVADVGFEEDLQFLDDSITSEMECSMYYPEHTKRYQECIKRVPKLCLGNSGDPLVQNNVIVGLASYRRMLCDKILPVVFTNVAMYIDFIKKYI